MAGLSEEQAKFMNLQEQLEEMVDSYDRAHEIIWSDDDGCLNLSEKILAPNPDYKAINLAIGEYIEALNPDVSIPVDVPTIAPNQNSGSNSFDFSQAVNEQARTDYFDRLGCMSSSNPAAAQAIAKDNIGNNDFVALDAALSEYVPNEQLAQYRAGQSAAPERALDSTVTSGSSPQLVSNPANPLTTALNQNSGSNSSDFSQAAPERALDSSVIASSFPKFVSDPTNLLTTAPNQNSGSNSSDFSQAAPERALDSSVIASGFPKFVSDPTNLLTTAPNQNSGSNSSDFSQAVNEQARTDYFDRLACISLNEGADVARDIAMSNMNNTNYVAMNDSLKDLVSNEQVAQYRAGHSTGVEDYADFYNSVYSRPEFEGMSNVEINDLLGFNGEFVEDVARWNSRQDHQNDSQEMDASLSGVADTVSDDLLPTLGEEESLKRSSDSDTLRFNVSWPISGEPVLYSADYNGNVIFYDEKATSDAVAAINKLLNNFNDHLDEVRDVDKFFDELESPYNTYSGIPDPRFVAMSTEILANIDVAYKQCISDITSVTDAIKDYAEGGNIDAGSLAILDSLVPPSSPPAKPRDDAPGTGPVGDNPNKDIDDSGIPDDVKGVPDDTDLGEDDNLVIPDTNNSLTGGSTGGSALGSTLGSDALEEGDSTLTSEDGSLANNIGTSLNGSNANRFFVPSLNSTTDPTDGVKSSGVIGAAATVAVAALAVGGKVYHDKKQDDAHGDEEKLDNDGEVDVDQSQEKNPNNTSLEKIGTGNDEINFDLNSIKFKNALINNSDVDD